MVLGQSLLVFRQVVLGLSQEAPFPNQTTT